MENPIINEIKQRREELYQELVDNLEVTKAEDFKYYEVIDDFKNILQQFEELRNQQLEILGSK